MTNKTKPPLLPTTIQTEGARSVVPAATLRETRRQRAVVKSVGGYGDTTIVELIPLAMRKAQVCARASATRVYCAYVCTLVHVCQRACVLARACVVCVCGCVCVCMCVCVRVDWVCVRVWCVRVWG